MPMQCDDKFSLLRCNIKFDLNKINIVKKLITLLFVHIYYLLLAFPADIGRKPASPARGSRQRLHPGYRAVFAGHAYTPANEAAKGATWRRP